MTPTDNSPTAKFIAQRHKEKLKEASEIVRKLEETSPLTVPLVTQLLSILGVRVNNLQIISKIK